MQMSQELQAIFVPGIHASEMHPVGAHRLFGVCGSGGMFKRGLMRQAWSLGSEPPAQLMSVCSLLSG